MDDSPHFMNLQAKPALLVSGGEAASRKAGLRLPAAIGTLAALAQRFRGAVKARLPDVDQQHRSSERTLDGPASALARTIAHSGTAPGTTGEVYLVGAGPGDPELLTLRAVRLLQQADVIVYDHLVGDGVLGFARRDAHRIYVGKEARNHTLAQPDINDLLVRLARQGKRVLRLKGGDPLIFGRGGEEAEVLAAHGIPFQIVPGVTAAAGAASYAGIPLTHRDHAHACVFVTGHLKDGTVDLDWPALARRDQTVVVYMGLGALPALCNAFVRHGLPDDWPAAVIERATTPEQRVVTGSLRTLPHLAKAVGIAAPALVIVGQVVTLHRKLAWFDPQAEPRSETVLA